MVVEMVLQDQLHPLLHPVAVAVPPIFEQPAAHGMM
jgi:hypothetical protein